jgi:tetratricopeptide (TPR) repeat protein
MWPQYVAKALMFRGHLRDAYETDRRLLLQPAASEWSGFMDPFLELSLLGVIPESIATATFARSLAPGTPWDSYILPRSLRGGPWWLARRDTTSLSRLVRRAAEVGRRPRSPQLSVRARLLGVTSMAYLALARGDSATALQQLEALPDTLCLADGFSGTCVYAQITLARLLGARGESRRSAELLERWRWGMRGSLISLATLELGRLAEAMGEREKAIQAYQFVVDAWRRADPELQPYVTEAREALDRLRKE